MHSGSFGASENDAQIVSNQLTLYVLWRWFEPSRVVTRFRFFRVFRAAGKLPSAMRAFAQRLRTAMVTEWPGWSSVSSASAAPIDGRSGIGRAAGEFGLCHEEAEFAQLQRAGERRQALDE